MCTYDGDIVPILSTSVTHVVVIGPIHNLPNELAQLSNHCHLVTPDWVLHSVRLRKCQQESNYHPCPRAS
ncbi:hypothetical protein PHET_12118 [Paragonimus heterotremus]|uniref:BRCT domain-containing protein n=1 Tax=Paragonimus heterotremus TaxID=100268 RepID=A0A8J4SPM3_9TREM|nr:hypothetical protein PHET_12118 [Paragonimus heterotremus]